MVEKKQLFKREEKLNKYQMSVIMNTHTKVAKKCKWCNNLIWKFQQTDYASMEKFTSRELQQNNFKTKVFCCKDCREEYTDWVALTKRYRKNNLEKERQRKKYAIKKTCNLT